MRFVIRTQPKNKALFKRLNVFANKIIKICEGVGARPVVWVVWFILGMQKIVKLR